MNERPTPTTSAERPSPAEPSMAGVYALYTVIVLASALGNLSQTSVNAMLPAIDAALGVEVATGQWLTTGYMLALGITVPCATFLSRRFGPRTHILIGLALGAAGSITCMLASSFVLMLVGRLLQAASTGVLMPLMQTIAMTRFPAGRRATAMGVGGIAMGFAPNVGPTVGGALDYAFGWRSFFVLMLVCFAVLAIVTPFVVERGRGDATERLDLPSLAFSALGFGGVLLGVSQASSMALSSPFVWVPVIVGLVFVVAFFRRQARATHPLISLSIFASRRFDEGLAALCLLFGSFMGVTLVIPLFVQDLLGGTSLDAGLVLLPTTIAALVMNPLGGILTDRLGTRPVVIGGTVLLVIGAVGMCLLDQRCPLWLMSALQMVRACGVSSLIGPLQAWTLAKLEGRIVADGASFSTLARQVAASLGTAVMVLLVSVGAGLASGLDAGAGAGATLVALPYQLAFGFSALLSVTLLVFVVARVR